MNKLLKIFGGDLSNIVPFVLLFYVWWHYSGELRDVKEYNKALELQVVESYNNVKRIQEKLGKLDRSNWKNGKNKITIGN